MYSIRKNSGYSVANNIGLNRVKTKYALVLNPDAILSLSSIKNFFISDKVEDFWLMGPANDQMVKLNFENKNLIEVDNLKGFAIFFNMSKHKMIFLMKIIFIF